MCCLILFVPKAIHVHLLPRLFMYINSGSILPYCTPVNCANATTSPSKLCHALLWRIVNLFETLPDRLAPVDSAYV